MNTLLPAFNRDPAFIHALVRLYPAFIRGPAFIRRRRLIEEIRYIDILTIIINCSYSTCISSFFVSSIPTSLFIFKMFFRSLRIRIRIRKRNGDF